MSESQLPLDCVLRQSQGHHCDNEDRRNCTWDYKATCVTVEEQAIRIAKVLDVTEKRLAIEEAYFILDIMVRHLYDGRKPERDMLAKAVVGAWKALDPVAQKSTVPRRTRGPHYHQPITELPSSRE